MAPGNQNSKTIESETAGDSFDGNIDPVELEDNKGTQNKSQTVASNLADALNKGEITGSDAEDFFEKGEKKPGVKDAVEIKTGEKQSQPLENALSTKQRRAKERRASKRQQRQETRISQRREKQARRDQALANNPELVGSRIRNETNLFKQNDREALADEIIDNRNGEGPVKSSNENIFQTAQFNDFSAGDVSQGRKEFNQEVNEGIPVVDVLQEPAQTFSNTGDIGETLEELEKQSIIEGVSVIQQGQDVADTVTEGIQDTLKPSPVNIQGREEDLTEQQEDFFGNSFANDVIDFESELIGGAATVGTQPAGLALATPGAVTRSIRKQNTPSLTEGVVSGGELTKKEFTDNPGKFIAEETGEQLGEAVVGGAITGGVGAASALIPTPELEPSISPRTRINNARRRVQNFELKNRKGSARLSSSDATPSFVNSFGPSETFTPELVEPEPVTTSTVSTETDKTSELSVESSTQPVSNQNSIIGGLTANEVLSDSVSTPSSISQGRPDSNFESETETETSVETVADPSSSIIPTVTSSVLTDSTADTSIDSNPEPSLETEPDPSPSLEIEGLGLTDSSKDGDSNGNGDTGAGVGQEIRTSVAADLLQLNEKGGGKSSNPENPLSLRIGF